MSLDAAESFFYDDATLTAWSDALGDVLARARETKSIVIVDDFFPRAVAENLRDDLQRQPTDCWTSRAEDEDDDVAHDFSLCAHARAVSLFTRAACVMARGAAAVAYRAHEKLGYAPAARWWIWRTMETVVRASRPSSIDSYVFKCRGCIEWRRCVRGIR